MKNKKDIKTYANPIFSENFKTLMFERNITLKELSERTSYPLSTISTWRRGRVPRSGEALKRLAAIFGVDETRFFQCGCHTVIFANELPRSVGCRKKTDNAGLAEKIRGHVDGLIRGSRKTQLKRILAVLERELPLENFR